MGNSRIALVPEPLTSEGFAPYGEVIEAALDSSSAMNEARFERFDDLCTVDLAPGGGVAISIASCCTPTTLPLRIDKIERHPLGSQAFVPLQSCRMVVVVAPPGEIVAGADLRAFVTRPRQGFNYYRGTWHMPLIAFAAADQFLVIDRGGDEPNCEERMLNENVVLEAF